MARLFVYGTLKRGGCRSHLLEGQRLLGEATTVARYRMYNAGAYPALVEDEDGQEIAGEAWEVDERCLARLDAVEGVPTWYRRQAVLLQGPLGGPADAYIYCQSVAGMPECGTRWTPERASATRSSRDSQSDEYSSYSSAGD